MKVGDKCRILVDDPNTAPLNKGDIVTLVKQFDPSGNDSFWKVSTENKNHRDGEDDLSWYIDTDLMEVVQEKEPQKVYVAMCLDYVIGVYASQEAADFAKKEIDKRFHVDIQEWEVKS